MAKTIYTFLTLTFLFVSNGAFANHYKRLELREVGGTDLYSFTLRDNQVIDGFGQGDAHYVATGGYLAGNRLVVDLNRVGMTGCKYWITVYFELAVNYAYFDKMTNACGTTHPFHNRPYYLSEN